MRLGRDLYDRLGTLGAHTARMGTALQRSVEAYNQMVGALEARVLVSARKMRDLEVVEAEIPQPMPLETGPRVLTAMELIEAITADDQRPELDLGDTAGGATAADRRIS
jgi:DNA recombination protein RmuC